MKVLELATCDKPRFIPGLLGSIEPEYGILCSIWALVLAISATYNAVYVLESMKLTSFTQLVRVVPVHYWHGMTWRRWHAM